jgi:hypothetical protein
LRKFTIPLIAALLGGLATATPAAAVNEYTTSASFSPNNRGSKARPVPTTPRLAFNVRETEGKRPKSMEAFQIRMAGIVTNGARFRRCTATRIERDKSDRNCPSGSLIATGYARNLAGNRQDFNDRSIQCYLSIRLHNSGPGRMALFVRGDPNLAGDRNCPVSLATAIPVNITRTTAGDSTLRLVIPESLKHPVATLTNSIIEMRLNGIRRTTRYRGRTVGIFEAVGRCSRGRRAVRFSWQNEGNEVRRQTTSARCR